MSSKRPASSKSDRSRTVSPTTVPQRRSLSPDGEKTPYGRFCSENSDFSGTGIHEEKSMVKKSRGILDYKPTSVARNDSKLLPRISRPRDALLSPSPPLTRSHRPRVVVGSSRSRRTVLIIIFYFFKLTAILKFSNLFFIMKGAVLPQSGAALYFWRPFVAFRPFRPEWTIQRRSPGRPTFSMSNTQRPETYHAPHL